MVMPVLSLLCACLVLVMSAGATRAAEPAALVEAVSGSEPAFQVMDYVEAGTTIGLGSAGRVVLSYLRTCRVETITGGRVTVGTGASNVEGGRVEVAEAPCQASQLEVAQGRQEAAGAVYRVAAFEGQDWGERTIKGTQPVFRWTASPSSSLASIAVVDLDRKPPAIVWRGATDKSMLTYPADAPPLEIGVPYQVQVSAPDGGQFGANFSIDPGLEGLESVLGRLVPLGPFKPAAK